LGRAKLVARLAVAAAITSGAAGTPQVAHAQGLFDMLRGIFGGRPPVQRVQPPPVLLEGATARTIRA
jgi:hypothetical protein